MIYSLHNLFIKNQIFLLSSPCLVYLTFYLLGLRLCPISVFTWAIFLLLEFNSPFNIQFWFLFQILFFLLLFTLQKLFLTPNSPLHSLCAVSSVIILPHFPQPQTQALTEFLPEPSTVDRFLSG